jgi:adenylyltransferase/sulfurtransferase
MQAGEVIKLLTGIGALLVNKLLTFNLLNYELFVMKITNEVSVSDLIPKDESGFEATDYNWLCGFSISEIETLSSNDFLEQVSNRDTIVIDVREKHELPKVDFASLNVPLSELIEKIPEMSEGSILLFCQSGVRSLKAGTLLLEKFGMTKKISHLKGGINALKKQK